ncbi:MAG: ChaN family lipoprotein [Rhodobacteraceae bacterium]|nr:ChaN family lipoprotein [Paracoccaceae bacterium]
MKRLILILALVWAAPAWADLPPEVLDRARLADIVIVGEYHDNPDHHRNQARIVAALRPAALVWEMLDTNQAARVTPEAVSGGPALGALLEWEQSGWPDFAMYAPIFQAAPLARSYGAAVPRAAIRQHLEADPIAAFDGDATAFGLRDPLPRAQEAARMALQWEAHCQALPEETLAPMVRIQQVRDATLAAAAIRAQADTGGPVVVITGNGHARRDWGMPVYLARVRPDLSVFVLGQTEDGAPLSGGYDAVLSAPSLARPDPCAAFR